MPENTKFRKKSKELPQLSPKHFAFNPEQTTTQLLEKVIAKKRKAVFERFPLMFTLLTAFGFVAMFYGFEGVMDQTGLSENPVLLLAIGLGALIFTGTLYKKLGD